MASSTASLSGAQPWPSGYRTPLAVITEDDHRGWVIICCALGIVIVLLTVLIRIYIRLKVSPPFSADDHTLFIGTALALLQSALAFRQLHQGYGESLRLIPESHISDVEKLGWITDLFYVWTLYLSKICIVLLFKRIASGVAQTKITWVAFYATTALGVVSTFLVTLRCDVSAPWRYFNENCSSLPAQWDAITAFDIVTELGLFAMSVQLVWGLQTPLARKSRVVFAFGLRLPTVLISAFHIAYIHKQLGSSNPTLSGAAPLILRQTQLYYALMASTIPTLRPFLAGFATNYGAMGTDTVMHGSQIGHSSREKDSSFNMTSLNSSGNRRSHRQSHIKGKAKALRVPGMGEDNSGLPSGLRPDHARHRASISHETQRGADASSVASDESTRMIIKKEVQWQVTGEQSRGSSALGDVGV